MLGISTQWIEKSPIWISLINRAVRGTHGCGLWKNIRKGAVMWCMQRERVFAFNSSTTLGAVLFLWKSYISNFLSVLWFKMIWFYMHQMGEVEVGTYFSIMSLMTRKRRDFTLSLSMFLPEFQGGWVMMLWFGSWIVYDIFYVRSFYNSFLKATSISFPCQSIWCVKIPKRLSFFSWTAARCGILTVDNLIKKNLPPVNWCCLCRCDE